jgi:uncharacterized protein (DUF488 family)
VSTTDALDPLRKATRRLHEAEIERNRLIRSLRSQRQPITKLSEASALSVGTVHKLTRPSTIVSVGYEGRSAEQLLDALVASDVAVLVDVRENAISRKAGLSKKSLRQGCVDRGIEYVHEPSLGNPKDNRDGFRSGDAESRDRYEAHLEADGSEALDRVAELLRDRTVALLCFEADPCSCHRSVVMEHLKERDPLVTVRPA